METNVFLLKKDMFQGKFDLVYRFYYGRLNTKQKKCYEVMVRNALQYNKEFQLPYCLTEAEAAETFCAMMDDYPLFFFVNSYSYRITGNTMIFRITYRILEKNVQPLLDSIMKEVTPFVKASPEQDIGSMRSSTFLRRNFGKGKRKNHVRKENRTGRNSISG